MSTVHGNTLYTVRIADDQDIAAGHTDKQPGLIHITTLKAAAHLSTKAVGYFTDGQDWHSASTLHNFHSPHSPTMGRGRKKEKMKIMLW